MISVIVPVYNSITTLERCVRSLCAQTFEDLEIILVDDGSTDGPGALCSALSREDARIRVIRKENGGVSSARNAGIEAAKGEYLMFADSDDYASPPNNQIVLCIILPAFFRKVNKKSVNILPPGGKVC